MVSAVWFCFLCDLRPRHSWQCFPGLGPGNWSALRCEGGSHRDDTARLKLSSGCQPANQYIWEWQPHERHSESCVSCECERDQDQGKQGGRAACCSLQQRPPRIAPLLPFTLFCVVWRTAYTISDIMLTLPQSIPALLAYDLLPETAARALAAEVLFNTSDAADVQFKRALENEIQICSALKHPRASAGKLLGPLM